MELVLFDIHAKQRFIFSSTRLKENVGASFQITLLDSWVEESVTKLNLSVQWVSRSSGRLLLVLDCDSSARKLIGEVTRRAHAEAPEMDVSGVFVHMGGSYLSGDDLRAVDHVAYQYALNRSPALSRFAQMPFLLRANDSSLPAAPSYLDGGEVAAPSSALEGRALSLPAQVKVRQANFARDHFLNIARVQRLLYEEDEKLARDPTKLEELLQTASEGGVGVPSKVAVIHIDGNGVGGVMRRLDEVLLEKGGGALRGELEVAEGDGDVLRTFVLKISERLDAAVKLAFRSAWERVAKLARKDAEDSNRRYTAIPVVPVILGGDDVTVITSGDYALPFAAAYLRYYEEATRNDPILCYLTPPEGQDAGPMTAAAGVAIVKRNFPFHIAYELAEKLVNRAKKVGKTACPPCSTLDYHVLFDTTVLDPDEAIRGYESFTTRPFRLLNDETPSAPSVCNDGSGTAGSGDGEDSTSAGSSPNDLRHEPWEVTCRRVARFKGVSLGSTDESQNETNLEPFPRTRAARIRGLLSAAVRERAAHRDNDVTDAPTAEAADCETTGSEASEKKEDWVPSSLVNAWNEWKAACEEVGDWIDTELGGMGAVFDLLELSDLLPPSFFELSLPDLGKNNNTASEATE
ncbi:Cas10/Cmr2 second palm domain-containing protein [Actinomyces naeslundii]|uniref:Cas10/Cmr2 second palm domain-containing protein n=1 Tax=Actinomyces naeslundii TaxID=1655 RepID=UPI003FA15DF4